MTVVDVFQGLYWEIRFLSERRSIRLSEKLRLAFLKVVTTVSYDLGRRAALKQPRTLQLRRIRRSSACLRAQVTTTVTPTVQDDEDDFCAAIIVPIYIRNTRDAALVEKLLVQLSRQDRPAEYIILVDDASPIAVQDLVGSTIPTLSGILSISRLEQNSGPAEARNVGILEAKAKGCNIICFLDADCAPTSTWLKTMIGAHANAQHKGSSAYGGRTQATEPFGWVGFYHNFYGTLNGPRMADMPGQPNFDGRLLYAPSCNFSMRLTDAEPLLFDTDFPAASFEDVEFCCRVRSAGIAIRYLPDAVVYHAYDESVLGLARQFWKYGRWESLAEEKQPGYLELLRKSWAISCQQP